MKCTSFGGWPSWRTKCFLTGPLFSIVFSNWTSGLGSIMNTVFRIKPVQYRFKVCMYLAFSFPSSSSMVPLERASGDGTDHFEAGGTSFGSLPPQDFSFGQVGSLCRP